MTIESQTRKEPVRPIEEFVMGNVRAAVYENHNEKGRWFNVSIFRAYKNDDGWKKTFSFYVADLPCVTAVAEKASRFVESQKRQAA